METETEALDVRSVYVFVCLFYFWKCGDEWSNLVVETKYELRPDLCIFRAFRSFCYVLVEKAVFLVFLNCTFVYYIIHLLFLFGIFKSSFCFDLYFSSLVVSYQRSTYCSPIWSLYGNRVAYVRIGGS